MKKQTKRIIKALIVSGGLIIFVIGAILNNGFMLGIGVFGVGAIGVAGIAGVTGFWTGGLGG